MMACDESIGKQDEQVQPAKKFAWANLASPVPNPRLAEFDEDLTNLHVFNLVI
jgi:hypothetical protein